MPAYQIHGVDINCLDNEYDVGSGRAVLFVHGAGGNAQRWASQVEALKGVCRAIAVDLPGHGLSGGNPCDGVFLYSAWIKELVDKLELIGVIPMGHSMGGGIVQEFVYKNPGLVRGLGLIGTASRFNIDPTGLEVYSRGEHRPEWAKFGFSPNTSEEVIEKYTVETLQTDPRVFYMDLLGCQRFQGRGLNKIVVPTVVVCGSDDIATTPEMSRDLVNQIPGAQLVMIEKAAHHMMLEQPEALNEAIISFVRKIG
ncbi:MAG: alpha/beta fold hydrolase [Bacillota bacterium]